MAGPRTILYVDGLNLYYRALKGTPYRWLDLAALATEMLPNNDVVMIKYYTAWVSGRQDPGVHHRQQAYINALRTIPHLEMTFGRMIATEKRRKPVHPPPKWILIHDFEEKGSDVNLASHLLHDAWQNKFQVGAVLSADTDLCEPMRIVKEELKKPVGLISPSGEPSPHLKKVATFIRRITNARLGRCQFADPVVRPKKTNIAKPGKW